MLTPTRTMSVLTLVLLTSCARLNEAIAPDLPNESSYLTRCTDAPRSVIPGEPGTPLTNAQINIALGQAQQTMVDKDNCAHDWRAFYQDLKKSLKGDTSSTTQSTNVVTQ